MFSLLFVCLLVYVVYLVLDFVAYCDFAVLLFVLFDFVLCFRYLCFAGCRWFWFCVTACCVAYCLLAYDCSLLLVMLIGFALPVVLLLLFCLRGAFCLFVV